MGLNPSGRRFALLAETSLNEKETKIENIMMSIMFFTKNEEINPVKKKTTIDWTSL
jgi:sporulation protein YlmC with PRC-barrel domain